MTVSSNQLQADTLALDVGTTYTKAGVWSERGVPVTHARRRTEWLEASGIPGTFSAETIWRGVSECATRVSQQRTIETLAISAVAPALVVYDANDPSIAWGLQYHAFLAGPNSASMPERAYAALGRLLNLHSEGVDARYTDLAGYVALRAGAEDSPVSPELASFLDLHALGKRPLNIAASPVRRATSADRVFGADDHRVRVTVTSDSRAVAALAAAFGAPGCLYLGTFGCLLATTALGLRWVVSIPDFGQMIDQTLEYLPSGAQRDLVFDGPPGAGGLLQEVPLLTRRGRLGSYRKLWLSDKPVGNAAHLSSRAELEAVAWACVPTVLTSKWDRLAIAGGGSQNSAWLQLLADTLDIVLVSCDDPSGTAATYLSSITGRQRHEAPRVTVVRPRNFNRKCLRLHAAAAVKLYQPLPSMLDLI